jgi:S1-C subfamily serine protease
MAVAGVGFAGVLGLALAQYKKNSQRHICTIFSCHMVPSAGTETSVQRRKNYVTSMSKNLSSVDGIPAYKITGSDSSPRHNRKRLFPLISSLTAVVFMAVCIMLWSAAAVARGAPESFANLAEKLSPAVVNVSSTQMPEGAAGGLEPDQFPPGSPFEEFYREFRKRQKPNQPRKSSSLGSGFIIDPEGYIVTNNHVIAEAEEITVILHDNMELKAKIVGRDAKTDLALLKVETKNKLTAIKWGDSGCGPRRRLGNGHRQSVRTWRYGDRWYYFGARP